MNFSDKTSYEHLEDFIQRNLTSEDKVIDEVNLAVGLDQLEHSLVPFICKIGNKNAVTPFNSVTCPNFCDIDYDNSENEVTEIVEDTKAKWNSIASSVNSHRALSSSKPQKTVSAFSRSYYPSTKFESLTFPSRENGGRPKTNKCVLQSARKGSVLKENNCSDLSRNVKPRLHFGDRFSLPISRNNENHFCERTQENSHVPSEVGSVNSGKVCRSGDSDSDDELTKVPVALSQSDRNEPSGKAVDSTKEHKSLKISSVSSLSLDKILEVRKSEMENTLILKTEQLLSESNIEVPKETELLHLMKQADNPDRYKIEKDRTVDLPPGLEIFNLQICHNFCPLHGLSLKSCGFIEHKGSLVEQKLARMPMVEIQEMIALGFMKTHLNSALFKEALLKYLFKILSAHDNERLTYSCQKTFLWYINSSASGKNTFYWYPTVSDVIETILNYGINVTNNCPIKDFLLNVEKTLDTSECSTCSGKENHEFSLVINGLNRVIKTLTWFLEQKCLHTYYQGEICDLVLLFSWLSLDVRLLGKWTDVKLRRCIAAGLEMIPAFDWPEKMKYLAEKLAELGGHHRNTLHVALGLSLSERGLHLQRAVSFLAVQHLLEVENPCFFADVTPFILLELLKLNPLHHVMDCFLLHSIISLLDLCVGSKVLPLYREALSGMCTIALNTYNKIGNTLDGLEAMKVRSLLLSVYGKWKFLILKMPHTMASIHGNSNGFNS